MTLVTTLVDGSPGILECSVAIGGGRDPTSGTLVMVEPFAGSRFGIAPHVASILVAATFKTASCRRRTGFRPAGGNRKRCCC